MQKFRQLFSVIFILCFIFISVAVPCSASGDKYFRDQLNSDQKAVYDAVVKAIPSKGASTCAVTVNLPKPYTVVTDDFGYAFQAEISNYLNSVCMKALDAVRLDYPYFFWGAMSSCQLPTSGSVTGEPPYTLEFPQIALIINVESSFSDVPSMVSKIKSEVAAIKPSGSTLYEKVKSIHDQICAKVTYDNAAVFSNDLVSHTSYGALINKKAVCEGYAQAFKLVCDKNGIDCVTVRGTVVNSAKQDEGHMWNYVKMDDGKWYGVDCTWDDNGDKLSYEYFLFNSGNGGKRTVEKNETGLSYPSLSKNSYNIPEEHVHSFKNWKESSADSHKGTCSCGETKTEKHSWDDGKVITAPTCAEKGEKTYTCKVCGAVKKEKTEKTDSHTYGDWISADGESHIQTCSVCGKTSKKEHNWDDGKITVEPTCSTEGVKTFICADCKAEKTETLSKSNDHNFGIWEEINDSQHQRKCECGEIQVENHDWDDGTVTKEATEIENGEKTYTCSVCGAVRKEIIDKMNQSEDQPQDPSDTEKKEDPDKPGESGNKDDPQNPDNPNGEPAPDNPTNIFVYIGIGLAVIVLIIVLIIIFSKKKKNKN